MGWGWWGWGRGRRWGVSGRGEFFSLLLGTRRRRGADPGFCLSSADLLATLATKRTPVLNVHFTPRNLCLAAGVMTEA